MTLIDPVRHPAPYLSTLGCSVCSMPPAWVSIYTGRRCETHKPRYDPQTAVDLLMRGWVDTARAYVRQWEEA